MYPLNGTNYPTWNIQCKMALMKEGLWSIVNSCEHAPGAEDGDKYAKFMVRRDHVLATNMQKLVIGNLANGFNMTHHEESISAKHVLKESSTQILSYYS